MKLYYSPAACSLAAHIALREAGLPFDLEKVDLRAHKTESGLDYFAINPKGYVPALKLDSGDLITEDAVILQYIADLKPAAQLAPAYGTMERVRVNEWLNFISSELHKVLGALFNPKLPADWKETVIALYERRCKIVAGALETRAYLTGDRFTIADAYLFVVLNWTKFFNLDLGKWPAIAGFMGRVSERPAVQAAMRAEGLIS